MRTLAFAVCGSVLLVAGSVGAQEAAAPAVPAAPKGWDTTVAAGANVTRGNTRTMLLNGSAVTELKTDANEYRAGVEVNYGETEVTSADGTNTEDEVNVQNSRAFGVYRRMLSARDYAYLNGEVLTDDIADIDYRFLVGPGLGRYFLKSEQQTLMGELGATYIQEKLAGDTDDTIALRVSEKYERKLSATAKVWESVEYLPAFDDFEQYLLNAEIGVEAAMTTRVNLRLVLQDKYNSMPAPGKDQNDLVIIGGLACKL